MEIKLFMKLNMKNFAPWCNTGAFYYGNLFPIHEDDSLNLAGTIEFEDDFFLDVDDNVIVPIWDKDHDWEYFIDDIKEYLLVHLEQLPKQGKYKPFVVQATIIDRIAKDKVTIIQSDDEYELRLDAIGIFKYKKL